MRQIIDGYDVFVVNLKTMPELPISWKDNQEALYAQALTAAIQDGVITEPGKYGIHIPSDDQSIRYRIFKIIE